MFSLRESLSIGVPTNHQYSNYWHRSYAHNIFSQK
jgi:hypothetical protein